MLSGFGKKPQRRLSYGVGGAAAQDDDAAPRHGARDGGREPLRLGRGFQGDDPENDELSTHADGFEAIAAPAFTQPLKLPIG